MGLRVENASVRRGGRAILDDVTLEVNPGEMCVILGRNGAGKSTLLSLLAGDLTPDSGHASLDKIPFSRIKPDEIARRRGVLLQESSLQFPFSVEEVVRLGRIPHTPGSRTDEDRVVHNALTLCGVADRHKMIYQKLSGGEKQRVHLARVLTQIAPSGNEVSIEPARYLLLDEPVSALDLYHQIKILDTVREMAHNGCGVLVILHDVNLAVRYADRIVFLSEGRIHTEGNPAIVHPDLLEKIYGISMHGGRDSVSGESFYLPKSKEILRTFRENKRGMKWKSRMKREQH